MLIRIEPLDTLFFRDGKPFTMGDDNWANGIFPPQPSVVYGAIRSAYFSNNIDDLKKAAGEDDPTKNLRIKGIYLFDSEENKFYLPLPMDCVQKKNEKKKNEAHVLLFEKLDKIKSSCPTEYSLKGSEEVENVTWGLINIELFKRYLESSEKNFLFLKLSDKILIEPKIGIGINKKIGTSEEGKLYRVGMNRLNNMYIVINFEGLDLPERGLMKLGGEGRAVYYEKFSDQRPDVSISLNELSDNRFKVYLLTPAIFKNGWIPEMLNNKELTYESKGFKVKFLTAAIGKPLSMGGFDMKNNKPKPMLKVVPAGSVYYFELIKGDIKEAYEAFNNRAISEFYPEQGYGLAFVGKIHDND
jgi:CRISPR-associated protein Cmr3